MVLLAIALIGAGLACLGFVGFSLLKGGAMAKGAGAAAGAGANSAGGTGTAFTAGPGGPGAGARAPEDRAREALARARSDANRAREAAAPGAGWPANGDAGESDFDHASDPASPAPGRAGSTASAAADPAGLDLRDRQELNFLRDRLTGLQRIDPDALNESLRVFEKTERETPEPAPQLVVTGMLYLDHGRKIPTQLGRRGEIPTRVFSELRRVGNGTLILENSSFLIHCGNTSYSYSAGDLDQILFQGSGLALVPIHPDRPIPLFLTPDVDSVKAYIKKNARIRAL